MTVAGSMAGKQVITGVFPGQQIATVESLLSQSEKTTQIQGECLACLLQLLIIIILLLVLHHPLSVHMLGENSSFFPEYGLSEGEEQIRKIAFLSIEMTYAIQVKSNREMG